MPPDPIPMTGMPAVKMPTRNMPKGKMPAFKFPIDESPTGNLPSTTSSVGTTASVPLLGSKTSLDALSASQSPPSSETGTLQPLKLADQPAQVGLNTVLTHGTQPKETMPPKPGGNLDQPRLPAVQSTAAPAPDSVEPLPVRQTKDLSTTKPGQRAASSASKTQKERRQPQVEKSATGAPLPDIAVPFAPVPAVLKSPVPAAAMGQSASATDGDQNTQKSSGPTAVANNSHAGVHTSDLVTTHAVAEKPESPNLPTSSQPTQLHPLAAMEPSQAPLAQASAPDLFTAVSNSTPPSPSALSAPAPTGSPTPLLTPAPAHVPTPAAQIAQPLVNFVRTPDGVQQTTIQLHPAELGQVQIRIEQAEGTAPTIKVVAEQPETLDLLVRDQPELQRALTQAGVAQDGRSLTFHLAGHDGPLLDAASSINSTLSHSPGDQDQSAAGSSLPQPGFHNGQNGAGQNGGGQNTTGQSPSSQHQAGRHYGQATETSGRDEDVPVIDTDRVWLRARVDITA
jgi:flagellar hook-length control protein FliK